MTSPEMAFPSPLAGRRDRLWPLVLVSLGVHAAAVTYAAIERPKPPIDLSQKPIMARLVRLGPKRPPELLPVKEPAAAPPAASPVAVPVPGLAAEPAQKKSPPDKSAPAKPGPKHDALAGVMSRMERDRALDRPLYGDPNGDPMGDSTEASEGDRYLALVNRALHDVYRVPATMSEQDRLYLKATVIVFVEPDGSLRNFAWDPASPNRGRSGNPVFDAALERAVREARLPPPPPELRDQLRKVGLGVHFHM